ncbi:hypothetical protein GLS_c24620 [Gluconobacter oxydans DSM 3504]|uniref:Phage integrase n=1 Tax=Gluconobacter oxydans DSM 3504 TaxID=1288313 RepID=A0A067Z7G6_GLUOY|nr:hypothetical protein GLS_c24620 [Gluconobacter oxydans DSM 3504]
MCQALVFHKKSRPEAAVRESVEKQKRRPGSGHDIGRPRRQRRRRGVRARSDCRHGRHIVTHGLREALAHGRREAGLLVDPAHFGFGLYLDRQWSRGRHIGYDLPVLHTSTKRLTGRPLRARQRHRIGRRRHVADIGHVPDIPPSRDRRGLRSCPVIGRIIPRRPSRTGGLRRQQGLGRHTAGERITGDRYHNNGRTSGGQIKSGWAAAFHKAKLPGKFRVWIPGDETTERRIFVPDITPHDLRHTWATWHYCLHKDLLRLKDEGGWSTINMVTRYAKQMSDSYINEISEFL